MHSHVTSHENTWWWSEVVWSGCLAPTQPLKEIPASAAAAVVAAAAPFGAAAVLFVLFPSFLSFHILK